MLININKYLYDNPKRTKVTMAWVSANCDVVKEKLMKEIEKVIDELKFIMFGNIEYVKVRELKQKLGME